jgi:hypothetical protein
MFLPHVPYPMDLQHQKCGNDEGRRAIERRLVALRNGSRWGGRKAPSLKNLEVDRLAVAVSDVIRRLRRVLGIFRLRAHGH